MYNKLSDKLMQHGLGRTFQQEAIHNYLNIVLSRLKRLSCVKDVDNQ